MFYVIPLTRLGNTNIAQTQTILYSHNDETTLFLPAITYGGSQMKMRGNNRPGLYCSFHKCPLPFSKFFDFCPNLVIGRGRVDEPVFNQLLNGSRYPGAIISDFLCKVR